MSIAKQFYANQAQVNPAINSNLIDLYIYMYLRTQDCEHGDQAVLGNV